MGIASFTTTVLPCLRFINVFLHIPSWSFRLSVRVLSVSLSSSSSSPKMAKQRHLMLVYSVLAVLLAVLYPPRNIMKCAREY